MAPVRVPLPVTISLRETGFSFVLGAPGVPRSIPRIETVIEIRHRTPGQTYRLQNVQIELRTDQSVVVPSTIGSNDSQHEYLLYKDANVFTPSAVLIHEEMLGCDIPLRVLLPRNITSSSLFPYWSAQTSTKLVVIIGVVGATGTQQHSQLFPISILRYDTLPIYRQFGQPVEETVVSRDKNVIVELRLAVSSLGPQDQVDLVLLIRKQRSKKHITLRQITYQIREILECHQGGLPPHKDRKIYTTTSEWTDHELPLTVQGVPHLFKMNFPAENDFLALHSGDMDLDLEFDSDKSVDKSGTNSPIPRVIVTSLNNFRNREVADHELGIPITQTQAFTSSGTLFSVRFELNVKLKFHGSKDMDFQVPITVCPFDYQTSESLLYWINKECEIAKQVLGAETVNRIVHTENYEEAALQLRLKTPPAIVYRDNVSDWVRMGYDAGGYKNPKLSKRIGLYVD